MGLFILTPHTLLESAVFTFNLTIRLALYNVSLIIVIAGHKAVSTSSLSLQSRLPCLSFTRSV